MFEPWVALESLSREHHREILALAEVERLLRRRAASRELSVRARFQLRTWLGRGLVTLGNRMQEADRRRFAPTNLERAS